MSMIRKIADKVSNYNRQRKYNFFVYYFKPTIYSKILDVGASEKEYTENANILEKKYPYPENITVLGIDHYIEFCKKYPKVKTVTYEGEGFPFKDKEFDICWCNAVIEHVGNRDKQERFLKNIQRVAKMSFVTTPNRYFPFEVHTRIFLLYYLPKGLFDKILNKIGKSWATEDYMHLLGLRDIKKLLRNCGINEYKITKNKVLGFTIDYVIMF